MKNISNYLEENLYKHILIDNCNVWHINEKYGLSEDIKNVGEKIINDILDDNLLNEYKCPLFTIKIQHKYSTNIIASYNQDKTDYKNKIVYISIEYPKQNIIQNIDDICSLIGHELTHALEDINMKMIMSNAYVQSTNILFSNGLVNKYKKSIARFLYLLDTHEQNAYLSQLTYDIKKIINKHNWDTKSVDYKLLISELKSEDNIWYIYFSFQDFIDNINNYHIEEYKKITDEYSLSKNQVIHKLNKKFNRFKQKFEINVPKIIFDNLPEYNGLIPTIKT